MTKPKWGIGFISGAAIAAAWIAAISQSTTATASTLRIVPVRIEMAATKQFCALTISNDAPEAATVQIRGYGWSKDSEGNDILDSRSGPTVNPAIVTIAGGEERLIRCSLSGRPGQTEESYRLIIDELPGTHSTPGTVQTLLQISIPLFRTPAKASPALDWSVTKGQDGKDKLVLANRGNRHAQVMAVLLKRATAKSEPVRLTRGFYLLAGGRTTLPLSAMQADSIATVELETTQGRLIASPASSSSDGN